MPEHLQKKVYLLLAALHVPAGYPSDVEYVELPTIGSAERSGDYLQVHLYSEAYAVRVGNGPRRRV